MSKRRIVAGFGAIALALAACQGGNVEGQTGAPSVPAVPSDLESMAPPSGLESLVPSPSGNQLFPVFQAQGGSNLTGGAIITDVDGESSVVIGVVAPGAAEMLPAAIIEGDCASQTGQGPVPPPELFPSPAASGEAGASPAAESPAAASPEASAGASPGAGQVSFPLWLTPVAVGSSNSVIGVGVEDLVSSPHAIIIETSPEDPTLMACADLQEGAPTQASPGASAPATSPDAGTSPGTSP
jgi:hypothetical protein